MTIAKTDFFSAIENNKRKTFWFFAFVLIFSFAIGAILGILWSPFDAVQSVTTPSALTPDGIKPMATGITWGYLAFKGGLVFMLVGLGMSTATYLWGDKLLVRLGSAKEVSIEEEPVLHHVVEEMAVAGGMPKPKIAVADKDELNAYATGMQPENAVIVITRGAIKNLSREELQSVIAHEMAHIRNWDTRYTTYISIFIGLTLFGIFLANKIPQGAKIYKRIDKAGYKDNSWIISLISGGLAVLVWLAPFLMRLMKNNASFEREFLADASAVQFTRNPTALISALEKFKASPSAPSTKLLNPATQFLSFAPYWEVGLFSEIFRKPPQPTLDERIMRLKALA